MALSFLRHLKPETLKSRGKKFPATETPIQTETARNPRLKDESPAEDTISGKDIMVGGGGRAEEEEEESGISMDSSSEFSRRESDESQETDPEVASTSTIEDLEDGRTSLRDDPVENHTGHLEDAASDISSNADTESGEHQSGSLEYSEAHLSDNLNRSPSLPRDESGSLAVPTLSSSSYQHGEDAADDLESYLSTTSRQEPGAFINSQSSRLSSSEDTTEDSLHSQDSSEISVNTIATPPVPPPPAPPLPPSGLGLLLPGDHTTSSTTDFQPTSASRQEASAAAGRDAETTDDDLMVQIKAAANKMSNHREKFSPLDASLPKAKPPTKFPESFSSDLKSVIASRQSRISTSETDGGRQIPGKVTFYKARIGIPDDDTELRRVFLKRAAKATPENTKNHGSVDEQPAPYQEVRGTRVTLAPISDSKKSSGENTKHFKAINIDEKKFDANVVDEIAEQRASAVEDASAGTYEDTEQNVIEEMSWQQNESGDTPDNIDLPSTMIQNSGFELDTELPAESHSDHTIPSGEPAEEFDKVVDDFDQFLEENVSTQGSKDPSEISLTTQRQIEISPVLDPQDSDVDFRNSDNTWSPEPAYTNGMSENSSSFSPNLSTFSEAESPVFDEMDELAVSTSAQTVHEHAKRLSQPLESYNILPTIAETSARNEPKTKFSFRNMVASLRHTIGRRKQSKSDDGKRYSVGDGSQMKFDENWSIHDTITLRGHTSDDRNDNKSRSLKDVFTNYDDVKSLSEFTDSDKNAGKDFSVRNWKEVVERSKGDIKNMSETLDEGNPNASTETAGFPGLLTKRANSTPNLGSLSDLKYSPQNTTKPQLSIFTSKNSRALKKPKSSNSKAEMDDLTSNTSMESPSRQGSSNLNSTLPSRRLHGMMQSFDSIYPGAPGPNPNRYQKKTEPRKFSLPSKGTAAGILSPVQRRKQRSQQTNR
jgi:hypothetical protein